MKITSAHGGGGKLTDDLIHSVFLKHYANDTLARMEDAAVLPPPSGKLAFTTDSFVVSPLFFPGGDIGRLSICGTVNDLLMRGATPLYLSAGFILQEGLDLDTLDRVVAAMGSSAREAGVQIVAGDTKVVEGGGGMFINTSGIGVVKTAQDISVQNAADGDVVIISGNLGDHHACILSSRMGIENDIRSDCAPLTAMVSALLDSGIALHAMRDITRGGLATVLHEIAIASGVHIALREDVPLASAAVRGFCDILGLDPLYMGNEGKMALLLPEREADKALEILRASPYGAEARIIGAVHSTDQPGVTLQTRAGSMKRIGPMPGEGLPRIC